LVDKTINTGDAGVTSKFPYGLPEGNLGSLEPRRRVPGENSPAEAVLQVAEEEVD